MTEADFVEMSGYLFSAWVTGWGSGFLIYSLRRLFNHA